MNLKPIEPGCLAFHQSAYAENCKVVRVGKCIGKILTRHGTPWEGVRWEVDPSMRTYDVKLLQGKVISSKPSDHFEAHANEANLIRIDGEDFSEETEKDQKLTENK